MITDWTDKIAVLTGAGSGLGLACARVAAQRGMRLVLVDVQQDALDAVVSEMRAAGTPVLARCVDVADAAQMEQLATDVQNHFGTPHWVFNNAGVGMSGLVWEHGTADWNWVLGVNLMGVVHGIRLFVPRMLEAASRDPSWRGHIVNTASMAGLLAPPNMGIYNVSKHAVVALTETLAQDLALVTDQIEASVLCPYFVPTGIESSARNRPQGLSSAPPTPSQRIGQAMLSKAVNTGKVTAAEVAGLVFDAMASGQFYIYSHPQALSAVERRFQDILHARHPSDPFADRPELGAQLREALSAGRR